MNKIEIILERIVKDLETVHVAGREEQRKMIHAIEVLEQLKTAIIVEEEKPEEFFNYPKTDRAKQFLNTFHYEALEI